MGNGEAAGNMGSKDQVLALKWIQKNIEAFGGDPNKVTISGESAGGESIVHLVLSPLAKGLFRGAIAQSGAALVPSAYKDSTIATAFKAGRHLGLFTENGTELVEYLRGRSIPELLEAQSAFSVRIVYKINCHTLNEYVQLRYSYLFTGVAWRPLRCLSPHTRNQ